MMEQSHCLMNLMDNKSWLNKNKDNTNRVVFIFFCYYNKCDIKHKI